MLDSHLTRRRLQRRLQCRRVKRVTHAMLVCDADGSAVGITRGSRRARAVLAPCSRRARAVLAPCLRVMPTAQPSASRATLAPCSRRARAVLAPCSCIMPTALPSASRERYRLQTHVTPTAWFYLSSYLLCSRTCAGLNDGVANYIAYINFMYLAAHLLLSLIIHFWQAFILTVNVSLWMTRHVHTLIHILSVLIISLVALVKIRQVQPRQRNRQTWIRTILQKREDEGAYKLLIPKLIANDNQFKNYFRMTKDSFALLLSMIEPDISKHNTKYRRSISGSERLAVTLRYLASGL